MYNSRSAEIKDYICKTFVREDKSLISAKNHANNNALPKIAIPENVGKLISMLAMLQKPKRILEVGTLAGYSTLWLAKGAPEAKIITLECNPLHAKVSRENFQNTSLGKNITLIEGDALESLKSLLSNKTEPFDLIFLDANKEGYADYLSPLIALSKPGTLLLTDNLIPREDEINHPNPNDPEAVNTYQYNDMIATNPKIESILVTTIVGDRGRIDALGLSIIKS